MFEGVMVDVDHKSWMVRQSLQGNSDRHRRVEVMALIEEGWMRVLARCVGDEISKWVKIEWCANAKKGCGAAVMSGGVSKVNRVREKNWRVSHKTDSLF